MRSRLDRGLSPWWNDPKAERDLKRRVLRNNVIAIAVMLIILVFSLNIGGCSTTISHLLRGA